jgi:hypothetical protein
MLKDSFIKEITAKKEVLNQILRIIRIKQPQTKEIKK